MKIIFAVSHLKQFHINPRVNLTFPCGIASSHDWLKWCYSPHMKINCCRKVSTCLIAMAVMPFCKIKSFFSLAEYNNSSVLKIKMSYFCAIHSTITVVVHGVALIHMYYLTLPLGEAFGMLQLQAHASLLRTLVRDCWK